MPVGVPASGATALTVAVNVTVWPNTDGFAEEANVVVVSAAVTVWVKLVEVLPVKVASPSYVAVIFVWSPTASDEVRKIANPFVSSAVPNAVASLLNVTVPVGVPVSLMTVAVNITGWPKTDGLGEEVMSVEELSAFTICVTAHKAEMQKHLRRRSFNSLWFRLKQSIIPQPDD